MTNKNTRQILSEKSAGYRPDALGAFHSSMVTAERKITPHLPSQHHLHILQRLIVQQPVQFCPLYRGVAVLVLHGDAVDGNGRAVRKPGFHSVGIHIVAAGKQFVHKEASMFFTFTSSAVESSGCPFADS